MVRSDENNNPTVISRPNVRARGGKPMDPAMPNRRALGDINRNIITAPPYHCTVHRESSHVPKKDQMLAKNQPIPPPSRPITRRFAAQMSCIQQQSASEGIKNLNRPVSSVSEPQVSDFKDVDDEMTVPSYVQHTQAMLDEIDLMDEEVEMEDVVDEHLVQDIDSCNKNNPLAVVEYIDDILVHYKKTENASCVSPNYMDNQCDINGKMRAILIDWLIEVHYKFELMEETLYLSVNLIDRFLACQPVIRKKLQLVGVTAMMIACKYEEVSVPVVEDFIVITDKAYTRREVIQMERLMVNTLQFNLSLPTPYMFMRRFLRASSSSSSSQTNNKLELLSLFMVELCLVEYEMLKYPPSMLSAAAVFTAQCTLNGHYKHWNMTCEWQSGYSQDQLLECTRMMVLLHQNAGSGKLTGVHRKYSTSKYGYAAKCEPALFLFETRF